jgi:peptidoglycan hydrolase CwlO-like protein
MDNETRSSQKTAIAIIAGILLVAALGAVIWFVKSANAEKARQAALIETLTLEKTNLESSLDSLQRELLSVQSENEELEGKVSASASVIEQKEIVIKQLKNQNTKELSQLQGQVASLQKAKAEYEAILAVLRAENEQLKAEIAALKAENAGLRDSTVQLSAKIGDLDSKLAEQVKKTQSARFKATSFRVEMERKTDKLTAKARRVRNLTVSFDLADVPEQYRGPQKLYLVITDANSKPIAAANPTKVTISAPTGDIPIIAQQTRTVNLVETQRMTFNYKLEEKLKAGNYIAAVYCDSGLLGASSFRLM